MSSMEKSFREDREEMESAKIPELYFKKNTNARIIADRIMNCYTDMITALTEIVSNQKTDPEEIQAGLLYIGCTHHKPLYTFVKRGLRYLEKARNVPTRYSESFEDHISLMIQDLKAYYASRLTVNQGESCDNADESASKIIELPPQIYEDGTLIGVIEDGLRHDLTKLLRTGMTLSKEFDCRLCRLNHNSNNEEKGN